MLKQRIGNMSLPLNSKGYTILEVMIAAVISSIGISALVSMQIFSVRGATIADDSQSAMQLADTILDRVRGESVLWTLGTVITNAAITPMLSQANPTTTAGTPSAWMTIQQGSGLLPDNRVNEEGISRVGSGLTIAEEAAAHFCAQYRLTWLNPVGQVLRVDVRVLWAMRRAEQNTLDGLIACDANAALTLAGVDGREVFSVYNSMIVRQSR
jgi:prepilin-type N-terminal cleavage/methylation domain-containing protein